MTNTASSSDKQPHDSSQLITFTVFPDRLARAKEIKSLSIDDLAALLWKTRARSKKKLQLLKLAVFGDVVSAKGCFRTNVNMGDIYGVEVEHDEGVVTFEAAMSTLEREGLSAIIYTTPSHEPGKHERWRILLPLSKAYPKAERAKFVSWVNGLFKGELANESFVMSQPFYFGGVTKHYEVFVIDGTPLDQHWHLADGAIGPRELPNAPVNNKTGRGYEIEDLQRLLDQVRATGDYWHNSMVSVTASLAAKGWNEDNIAQFCADYCNEGADDPDLWVLIDSARAKFGRKDPTASLRELLRKSISVEGGTPDKPPIPPHTATLDEKTAWMLSCYGYMLQNGERVVDIYEPSDNCLCSLNGLMANYASFGETVIGPKKGTKRVTSYGAWYVSPHRLNIGAIEMRPDRPFPLFEENGKIIKNTYLRPHHSGQGDITPWLSFMDHLLPDPAERNWFCDWLAHKYQHPAIPGVAVVMVAANNGRPVYGTGRGMLFAILQRLMGSRYVRPLDFDTLIGNNSQSVYTDWMAYSIMVTVSESKDTPDAGRWSWQRATYERIKELIEPKAVPRQFRVKFRPAFFAPCFVSYLIATNNSDALQLPPDDRRIVALSNGVRLPTAQAAALSDWMDQPGNIAALANWLSARTLSTYSPYEAPMFKAKSRMQDLARTDLDEWMDDLREQFGRDAMFTKEQAFTVLQRRMGSRPKETMEHAIMREIRKATFAADVDRLRMPRSHHRERILVWNDYAGESLLEMSVEVARAHVAHTDKIVSGLAYSNIVSLVDHLKKPT